MRPLPLFTEFVLILVLLAGGARSQTATPPAASPPAARPPASTSNKRAATLSNVNYLEGSSGEGDRDESHRLDVYASGEGTERPILLFIHGGAWKIGNKEHVQEKPEGCAAHGFVFVTTNYRLYPDGDYVQQASDIAHAVRWVHQHATEFRGSPRKIFLIGHSAGAHLAALVAIDPKYLAEVGLKPDLLRGVILLDGAGYDVPKQIEGTVYRRARNMYQSVFSEDLEKQRDASPIHHVAAGNGTPPFLLFHVEHRWDSKAQSDNLAEKLREATIEARVVSADEDRLAPRRRSQVAPGSYLHWKRLVACRCRSA